MSTWLSSFPQTRLRRNRIHPALRDLCTEHRLTANDLIAPVFVQQSSNEKSPIDSLPDVYRFNINGLLKEVEILQELGIKGINLYPVIPTDKKNINGSHAYEEDNIAALAIGAIREQFPEMIIMADVALDPYTSHGQDGIIDENGNILNDKTIEALAKQALCLAKAGAQIIAPSDMMDGRTACIRAALDNDNQTEVGILAYAAKYASNFYGPFRNAVGSSGALKGADKKSYQLNPANSKEALREVEMDIKEGADMIMVKPGMMYLDILYQVKQQFGLPTFAFQVSGEYSMLKAASAANAIEESSAVLEALIAFKRAGADGIFSYYAKQAASWLKESAC